MIKIGEFNELVVARESGPGYYLDAGTGSTKDDILLPFNSTMDKDIKVDDKVNAFIYRDSKDRLIATLKEPLAKVKDIAYLEVVANTKIGSFVDFGLDRDLFIPIREQKYNLIVGNKYLFYVYLDKTDRIAGTTDIEGVLSYAEEYKVGDQVKATAYKVENGGNVLVAVDSLYKGIILNNEYYIKIKPGEELKLRIRRIYEDGTLGLTPRKKVYEERPLLEEKIMEYLTKHNGVMPYNDKSSPEEIKKVFHESKNYFKKALGGLMKKGLIVQDEEGTKLK